MKFEDRNRNGERKSLITKRKREKVPNRKKSENREARVRGKRSEKGRAGSGAVDTME